MLDFFPKNLAVKGKGWPHYLPFSILRLGFASLTLLPPTPSSVLYSLCQKGPPFSSFLTILVLVHKRMLDSFKIIWTHGVNAAAAAAAAAASSPLCTTQNRSHNVLKATFLSSLHYSLCYTQRKRFSTETLAMKHTFGRKSLAPLTTQLVRR